MYVSFLGDLLSVGSHERLRQSHEYLRIKIWSFNHTCFILDLFLHGRCESESCRPSARTTVKRACSSLWFIRYRCNSGFRKTQDCYIWRWERSTQSTELQHCPKVVDYLDHYEWLSLCRSDFVNLHFHIWSDCAILWYKPWGSHPRTQSLRFGARIVSIILGAIIRILWSSANLFDLFLLCLYMADSVRVRQEHRDDAYSSFFGWIQWFSFLEYLWRFDLWHVLRTTVDVANGRLFRCTIPWTVRSRETMTLHIPFSTM